MPVNATEAGSADARNSHLADVVIIGDGVIGLSIAHELGRAGVRARVLGAPEPGAASGAAAGLLAPSIGNLAATVRPFFEASLALFPAFVDRLREYEAGLAMITGLLELSSDENQVDSSVATGIAAYKSGSRRLSRDDVALLEPNLSAPWGGVFHERDSAIDNVALMRALRRAVAASPSVTTTIDPVTEIDLSTTATVVTRSGARVECGTIILAAGAWSASIAGLPRALPVTQLKGQMLAVSSSALKHSVSTDHIYLVPRAAEIVIGATSEFAGFDLTVIPEAIERLRQAAVRACPALAHAPTLRTWAGTRPSTSDMLPILGPEPRDPRLIYACGHSRNGILLAPATAAAIAAMLLGSPMAIDATPFGIERFWRRNQADERT